MDESGGDDEEGREGEPDVLIEDHQLHEGTPFGHGGDGTASDDATIQYAAARRVRQDRGDDESGRREAEKSRVHHAQDRAGFLVERDGDPAAADEDDDAEGEEENFREGDDRQVERNPDACKERLRIAHEPCEDVPDALCGDDGDIGGDDHPHRLVLPDDEAVGHHDREEHDDEEIPAQGEVYHGYERRRLSLEINCLIAAWLHGYMARKRNVSLLPANHAAM